MLKINYKYSIAKCLMITKDDKNYCCTSAAGQAMLLQMHLLAAVLALYFLSDRQ
jgi:hypothetical protein